ncbi:MAG: DUF2459 domain-containing protein [Salinivenus sp.]
MARWSGVAALLVLLLYALVLGTRCHLPRQAVQQTADSTSTIYVVRHGWHAGVAVRRTDVPEAWGPAHREFPQAHFLEVGWGEARYYPGHTRGVWGVMRAGLWPTGSVLHVVPVPDSVPGTFPQNTIVRIPVGSDELEALGRFIADSFAQKPGASEPGFYPGSRFYPSDLSYHVFNNCNHWAAAALEAAGCDTSPRWTFTVGHLMRQARRCGTLVHRGPDA